MNKLNNVILFTGIIFASASLFCADYESSLYRDYIQSSGKSFYNSNDISFRGGWDSSNDSIDAPTLYIDNDSSKTAEQKKYNIESASFSNLQSLYVQSGANAVISNSSLNIGNKLSVNSVHYYGKFASSLTLKNCNTTLNANNLSEVRDGANMTVEGGSFTVLEGGSYKQSFTVSQGSYLTFKNTQVDFSGATLSTRTNSSYSETSAVINIDNSVFTTGYVDMYGYVSSGALPVLNITNGSNVTMSLANTYSAYDWSTGEFYEETQYMRGGTVNVSGDGSVLNLNSALIEEETNPDGQVYTSAVNISDGGKVVVAGDVKLTTVELFENSILEADNVEAENLLITEGANLMLGEGGSVNFSRLDIVLTSLTLQGGESIDLESILGDDTSVVLSALQEDEVFNLQDSDGNIFECAISSDGLAHVGAQVPEPASYAILFGVFSILYVLKRRKN